jgi:hypothetical protein
VDADQDEITSRLAGIRRTLEEFEEKLQTRGSSS